MNWKLLFAIILAIVGLVMAIAAAVMFVNRHSSVSSWILMIFGVMFFLFGLAGFIWIMVQDAEISISGGKVKIGGKEALSCAISDAAIAAEPPARSDYREACFKSKADKCAVVETPDIKAAPAQCYETKCYIPEPITVRLPDIVIQPSPVKIEQPCYRSTAVVCGGRIDHKVDGAYPAHAVSATGAQAQYGAYPAQSGQQQYGRVPDFTTGRPAQTTGPGAATLPFARQQGVVQTTGVGGQQPVRPTLVPGAPRPVLGPGGVPVQPGLQQAADAANVPRLSTTLYQNVPNKVVVTAPSNSPGQIVLNTR